MYKNILVSKCHLEPSKSNFASFHAPKSKKNFTKTACGFESTLYSYYFTSQLE